MSARTEAKKWFTVDFMKCLHAGVPLEKAVKFKRFLEKCTSQVVQCQREILFAESTCHPYFLHISRWCWLKREFTWLLTILAREMLATPEGQGKSYVIIVDFLTHVNHSTIFLSVIWHFNAININLDNVHAFVSYNASYMKKEILALNLVLEVWPVVFKQMNKVVTLVKKKFCQSPLYHCLYCEFMDSEGIKPKLPVYAVLTRWGTWIDAVTNTWYVKRVSIEVVSAAASFKELKSLLDTDYCHLNSQALFIDKYSCIWIFLQKYFNMLP